MEQVKEVEKGGINLVMKPKAEKEEQDEGE